MSQQGNSIGRDVTVTVILPDGTDLDLGDVTKFDAKQITTDDQIVLLTGRVKHLRFYQGWSGTINVYRTSSDLDAYFGKLEANYYAGLDESLATLIQTISEPDGSVSQWQYTGVLMKFDDPGEWSSDKAVAQSVSFMATTRIQQA